MHRSLIPLLPLLALALMGNSCDFAAVSNNSISPEGEEGRPTDGNGLVVVIAAVDSVERQEDMVPPGLGVGLVASALSASALSSPAFALREGHSKAEATNPEMSAERAEPQSVLPVTTEAARSASAVPEPSALLIFASGIGLSALRLGKR